MFAIKKMVFYRLNHPFVKLDGLKRKHIQLLFEKFTVNFGHFSQTRLRIVISLVSNENMVSLLHSYYYCRSLGVPFAGSQCSQWSAITASNNRREESAEQRVNDKQCFGRHQTWLM